MTNMKLPLLVILVAGYLSAQGAKAPVVDVKLLKDDRDKILTKAERKIAGVIPDYAMLRPRPFIYPADAISQKRVRGAESSPFMVGGLNCDQNLSKHLTITGLSIEELTARGKPGNQTVDRDPAWAGANNRNVRSSFDGFLTKGQTIREILLKDNKTVRKAGLTHQMVIEPVLTALEKMNEMVEAGTDWDPELGFDFTFGGQKYSVVEETLGLIYFTGLKYDDDMKKVDEAKLPKVRIAARRACKSYYPGWNGSGVQGSIFNDDIYSSCNLTFNRQDGKKLTIDCLTPNLIHRYGFYQGGPYRQDPENLISFFNLKFSPEAQAAWNAACSE